jgi:hypothetical protein
MVCIICGYRLSKCWVQYVSGIAEYYRQLTVALIYANVIIKYTNKHCHIVTNWETSNNKTSKQNNSTTGKSAVGNIKAVL